MLIFSGLVVIFTGLVFQLIGLGLGMLLFDVSLADLNSLEGDISREVMGAVKLLQIIGALGTFIFSSFLLSFFYTGRWFAYFPFRRKTDARAAILLSIIMITALPFVNMLTDLNLHLKIPFERVEEYFRQLEEQTESLMMKLISADSIGQLLLNLFMIAIIPAVGEELVFRGLLQRHLTELFKNGHVAILVAASIFSLAHFQIYSFLPRFFLGLILGYAFHYGKNIWYPILAHLVNNALGVVFYYFYMKNSSVDSIEEIGTMEMMPYVALLSVILVGGLLYVWIRMVQTNETD